MFTGLRVIELASVLAGPSVGQFFAELGAEVIKVENFRAGGDVTRSWKLSGEETDDRSAYFCSVNWGKQSLAVDLSSPEGRKIIHQLVKTADLVIASYKPGDAEKLGMDCKTLSAINNRVIYGQITGYGSDNPRVGYDAVVQAEAGFMFMNGEPDGPSLKMPVALVDILAAHHLKEGILLAMLNRERNGKGELVEVSLIQAAVASLANQASNWLVASRLPQKQGSAHPNIAPYGDVFTTFDGREILLAIGSDRQFRDLCGLLNISELANDPLFQTNPVRVQHRAKLNEHLRDCFIRLVSNEILPRLHQAKIPAGMIQNMKQVFEMPEAKELLLSADGIAGARTIAFNTQSFFTSTHIPSPPHLGDHTHDILQSRLGYDAEMIQRLREAGAIQ